MHDKIYQLLEGKIRNNNIVGCLELQRGQVSKKKEEKINKYKQTYTGRIDKMPVQTK